MRRARAWMIAGFAVLGFLAPAGAASADVGAAVHDLQSAPALLCGLELARESLRVGIALASAPVPCVERIAGTEEPNGRSEYPALSVDGRFVAFNSFASNFVPDDLNEVDDVFVHDRSTGATTRVSLGTDGAEALGPSSAPVLDGEGRFVVFQANSPGLVPGVGFGYRIYIRDRDASADGVYDEPGDVLTLVASVAANGEDLWGEEPATNRGTGEIPGGRFVAYRSLGVDLTNQTFWNVEVYDRDTDGDAIFDEPGAVRTARASVTTGGAGGTDGNFAGEASLSADGRCIAFRSDYANLALDDLNGTDDVFVRDRDTDGDAIFDEPGAVRTVRVSVATTGAEADGRSRAPSISADGRFVAFHSLATTLDPACANGLDQIFVRDRDTDADGLYDEPGAVATECVSLNDIGDPGDGPSTRASISPDGRFVAYRSEASNLVPGDANGAMDVLVYDRLTGETTHASAASDGTEGDGPSGDLNGGPAVIDGGLVAFGSAATNLAPGDTNAYRDIFVRDPDAAMAP